MGSRYVEISKEQFDGVADGLGLSEIYVPRSGEAVYERLFENGKAKVRVFSSISLAQSSGRGVGKDAIRTVLFVELEGTWIPFKKLTRVHRTKNWANNLTKRIDEARRVVHPEQLCSVCGEPLLLREGKYGEFYSCSAWPKTRCPGKLNV